LDAGNAQAALAHPGGLDIFSGMSNPPVSRPHPAQHTIYKPNTRGSGGAVRFEFNFPKGAVFIEAANQTGPKQFDWERKIIMKMGINDLGAMLAVFQGRQMESKLFHQTDGVNSAIELTQRDDPQRAPYLFSISRQVEADRELRKLAVPLTHVEATILKAVLREAVVRLLGM